MKKAILITRMSGTGKRRLSTRTMHDFARSPEMQDWIIEIKKPFEDSVIATGAIVVNADGSLEETAERVLGVV